MADLVVVTFKNAADGPKALADLRALEKSGGIGIDDVEIIERDAAGRFSTWARSTRPPRSESSAAVPWAS